jgi:hypothetical protein
VNINEKKGEKGIQIKMKKDENVMVIEKWPECNYGFLFVILVGNS